MEPQFPGTCRQEIQLDGPRNACQAHGAGIIRSKEVRGVEEGRFRWVMPPGVLGLLSPARNRTWGARFRQARRGNETTE